MFFAAPSDNGTAPRRYLASQLHEPSSENSALGLPILDWSGSTWDSKSPEAQFTFSLGLLKVLQVIHVARNIISLIFGHS